MSTTQKRKSQNRHTDVKRELTPKQTAFVEEYLIDNNGTQAAIRAGYSAKTAKVIAAKMTSQPGYAHVQAAIAAAKAARSERMKISQDDVLQRWVDLAMADARDLVEYRRCACRFCWGTGHAYQWRTEREFDAAVQEAVLQEEPPPSNAGGFGYSRRLQPNPDCPECDGVGEGQMIVKDTRTLAGGAALLYAGTNIGKDGLKVLMEDRAAALTNVAKHIGMLDPKLTLKGDKENPLQLLLQQVQGSALKPTAQPEDDE